VQAFRIVLNVFAASETFDCQHHSFVQGPCL
jgi:hypothetical protein